MHAEQQLKKQLNRILRRRAMTETCLGTLYLGKAVSIGANPVELTEYDSSQLEDHLLCHALFVAGKRDLF